MLWGGLGCKEDGGRDGSATQEECTRGRERYNKKNGQVTAQGSGLVPPPFESLIQLRRLAKPRPLSRISLRESGLGVRAVQQEEVGEDTHPH